MAAYHQMGNDTENLVGEVDLQEFRGVILSPVNRTTIELARDIGEFRNKGLFDIVVDPQLYVPNSERGVLPQHSYFPTELDTADTASELWWTSLVQKLSSWLEVLDVNAVASPAVLPRVWSDEYYQHCVESSVKLSASLGSSVRTLMTVMVDYSQMTPEAALRIASIVSEAEPDGYYLVVVSNVEPRRELNGEMELAGIMHLIRQLESTQRPVIVSHCASDMVLYKIAGASHCATGKFFNLRRFTRSRYEDPASGGGQLPYWFEHSLFAFLRQADLGRIAESGFAQLIRTGASNNYWAERILEQFASEPGKPWLALAWRQYLSWFGKTEAMLSSEPTHRNLLQSWLINAEQNWLALEDDGVLLDEPRNKGISWLRPWRQALNRL